MTEWLIRHCVKDCDEVKEQKVRESYGTLGSLTGITVNCLLSAVKFVLGIISGSLSITADAVNNLSDAAGSIMSLVTVRMAAKPVDKEHPFGHGRMEYIGALAIGVMILIAGLKLLESSINGVLHPGDLTVSVLIIVLLALSILSKVWLFFFYRKLGKKIDSETLLAASKDSISDVIGTCAILASMVLQMLFGWNIDGYMGILVACFVLKTGFDVCKETIDLLLGEKPDPQLVKDLRSCILSCKGILGIHDLMVHDYGPGRRFVTVHAEVDAHSNIVDAHELIDEAEREIAEKMHVDICIHMDPVVTDDPVLNKVQGEMADYLKSIDPNLSLHDFRMVPGQDSIKLVFDCLLPSNGSITDTSALKKKIDEYAQQLDPRYSVVVRFDVAFC